MSHFLTFYNISVYPGRQRFFFWAYSWALSTRAHGYFIVVIEWRMIGKRPAGIAGEKEGWRPSRSGQEARLRSGTIRKDLSVGRKHTQIPRTDLWSQGDLYVDPCLRRTLCVNCSVLFLSLSLIHMNLLIPSQLCQKVAFEWNYTTCGSTYVKPCVRILKRYLNRSVLFL